MRYIDTAFQFQTVGIKVIARLVDHVLLLLVTFLSLV